MAAYDVTSTAAAKAELGVAGRLFAAFSEWNDARMTRKALSRLSDRELDDIGLTRGDIARIAAR